MIHLSDLRINNLINYQGVDIVITEELFTQLLIENNPDEIEPVPLTKEWARDLGLTVTDMGDFWEFEKGDFLLIQFKVPITGKVLIPVYILHTLKSRHIKVPFVHKLQNLYYEIQGEELSLK